MLIIITIIIFIRNQSYILVSVTVAVLIIIAIVSEVFWKILTDCVTYDATQRTFP